MLSNDYKRLRTISNKLFDLKNKIDETKYNKELGFGNGFEYDQLDIACAALETILQETDY